MGALRIVLAACARLLHEWSSGWVERLAPKVAAADGSASPAEPDPFAPGAPPAHWLDLIERSRTAGATAHAAPAVRARARTAPTAAPARAAHATRQVAEDAQVGSHAGAGRRSQAAVALEATSEPHDEPLRTGKPRPPAIRITAARPDGDAARASRRRDAGSTADRDRRLRERAAVREAPERIGDAALAGGRGDQAGDDRERDDADHAERETRRVCAHVERRTHARHGDARHGASLGGAFSLSDASGAGARDMASGAGAREAASGDDAELRSAPASPSSIARRDAVAPMRVLDSRSVDAAAPATPRRARSAIPADRASITPVAPSAATAVPRLAEPAGEGRHRPILPALRSPPDRAAPSATGARSGARDAAVLPTWTPWPGPAPVLAGADDEHHGGTPGVAADDAHRTIDPWPSLPAERASDALAWSGSRGATAGDATRLRREQEGLTWNA